MKTVSEAIKILKDDHKCVSATKSVPMLDCCNCIQLESQLKESLNELHSVKLRVEILNDENKTLNQSSATD
jgi:hypothetical protein